MGECTLNGRWESRVARVGVSPLPLQTAADTNQSGVQSPPSVWLPLHRSPCWPSDTGLTWGTSSLSSSALSFSWSVFKIGCCSVTVRSTKHGIPRFLFSFVCFFLCPKALLFACIISIECRNTDYDRVRLKINEGFDLFILLYIIIPHAFTRISLPAVDIIAPTAQHLLYMMLHSSGMGHCWPHDFLIK